MNATTDITAEQCKRLVRFACGFLHNYEDAEEAVQDALLRECRHPDRFQGQCTAFTWLHICVRSRCIELKRIFKLRQRRCELVPLPEHLEPGTDARIEQQVDARMQLRDILSRGSGEGRLAELLADGCNVEEIAAEMGIKAGAVKSRTLRLRTRLKLGEPAARRGRPRVLAVVIRMKKREASWRRGSVAGAAERQLERRRMEAGTDLAAGMSVRDVASKFHATRTSVYRWQLNLRRSGREGLKARQRAA